jgi:hypothetical protein
MYSIRIKGRKLKMKDISNILAVFLFIFVNVFIGDVFCEESSHWENIKLMQIEKSNIIHSINLSASKEKRSLSDEEVAIIEDSGNKLFDYVSSLSKDELIEGALLSASDTESCVNCRNENEFRFKVEADVFMFLEIYGSKIENKSDIDHLEMLVKESEIHELVRSQIIKWLTRAFLKDYEFVSILKLKENCFLDMFYETMSDAESTSKVKFAATEGLLDILGMDIRKIMLQNAKRKFDIDNEFYRNLTNKYNAGEIEYDEDIAEIVAEKETFLNNVLQEISILAENGKYEKPEVELLRHRLNVLRSFIHLKEKDLDEINNIELRIK